MWNERYSAKHYIYGVEPNNFLFKKYPLIPAGKVLCLAEGEGRNAVFLAKHGYQVTAVDSSEVGLSKAARLAEKNDVQLEIVHCDLADFDPGKEEWAGIVSIFCHVPQSLRVLLHHRVVEGLEKNGVLLLEAYTPAQLLLGTGGPADAALTMTAESLKRELAGLHFSYLEELEREVVEGSHHTGTGAVVQAVAEKQ